MDTDYIVKMSSTEANRNFSTVMERTDKNGIVEINRKRLKYFMLTYDEFKSLSHNTIAGKYKNGLCIVSFK